MNLVNILLATELAGGVVVGLSITEAAATVTLLRDDGTGALARVEATATRRAVSIAAAWAGDELGTRGLARA